MLVKDMGVDFCGGDICMAQQHLDGTQIGAACQQMRGKGVTQRVWCHFGR